MMIRTTAPIAVALAGSVALGAIGWQYEVADRAADRAERARARAFLASQSRVYASCAGGDRVVDVVAAPCEVEDVAEVDGALACWRIRHDVYGDSQLDVWPGCRGPAVTFDVAGRGMSLLAVPPQLAAPAWLRWLADRMVGAGAVSCVGAIDGCRSPGPAWRWVLASADRLRAGSGLHGAIAPDWEPLDPMSPSALVVSYVPEGWAQRSAGDEPRDLLPAGPRIIVDALTTDTVPDLTCAGHDVVSSRGGLGEWDAHHARFRWLWRGLPDRGELEIADVGCVHDTVLARTTSPFASVVAIDLATGGWLYEPASDCCDGARLWSTGEAPARDRWLWQRDDGTIIAMSDLGLWLAMTPAERPPLDRMADPRLELVDGHACEASHLARADELGDAFPASDLPPLAHAGISFEMTCAGWTISASPTAVLAERGAVARWLAVVEESSPVRMTGLSCEHGQVTVERWGSVDPFSDRTSSPDQVDTLVIDLARGRSHSRPARQR